MAVAVAASILNTVQAGANAQLNAASQRPLFAALMVYAIGGAGVLVAMAVLAVAGHPILPARAAVASVRWWAWTGGLMGLTYVFAMLLFAEKLGSGVFGAVTLSVGILTAVALDHFGVAGFRQHSAGVGRILGCLLMIAGATLIARF